MRRDGKRLTVTVELTETRTARIVWAEVLKHIRDDAFVVIEELPNRRPRG
jgi:TolB-like protein